MENFDKQQRNSETSDPQEGIVLRSGAVKKNIIPPRDSPSTPKTRTDRSFLENQGRSPALIALEETRDRVNSICEKVRVASEQRNRLCERLFGTPKYNKMAPENNDLKTEKVDTTTTIIGNIIKVIPVFTGEPAEKVETDLHIFLNISQAYYKTLSPPDQLIFLSLVPKLKLRGVPYEICSNKSFLTFEDFQQVLSEYYFPSKDLSGLTHEIQSCRQLNGETARQFGQRIDCKLKECEMFLNKLCKENAQPILEEYQRIAIQTFRRGLLSPSLKQYSCMLSESVFSKIIGKVSDMETLENQCHTPYNMLQYPVNNYVPSPQLIPNFQPLTMIPKPGNFYPVQNVNHGESLFQTPPSGQHPVGINQREPVRPSNGRKPVTCFKCGQPNHISRECRTPNIFCQNCRSRNHDTRMCPRLKNTDIRRVQTQVICDFCQRYGHEIIDCATKRRWDAKCSEQHNQGNGIAPVDIRSDRH